MKRFREEFIFVEGEYHFAISAGKAVRFQYENLNSISGFGLCCNLCVKNHHCFFECMAGSGVLINIKYFELYKKWENSIQQWLDLRMNLFF